MEDQSIINHNRLHTRPFLFIAITAVCVIIGGLCFNSQSKDRPNRVTEEITGQQAVYFTALPIPEKLDFAGEEVPLKNFDTRESLDRELLVTANFHSQTLLYLKKTNRYFSIIEPILQQNKIPEDFKYLALAESGFLDKVVSPAGAVGIWQFMKTTAIANGLEINDEVDERYHIEKATEAACKYLNTSYAKYKNWTIVAATYNAGINGIDRQVELQDTKNYYDLLLNEETSRYLFRILSLKLVISDPEKYGFKIDEQEKYPIIPTKEIKINGAITNWNEFAKSNNINYKLLKQFNPWLRQTYLKNLKNKSYSIKIPQVEQYRKFDINNTNEHRD